MKKSDLVKAGKNLNAVLFDPKSPEIDVDAESKILKSTIKDAAKLLAPSDDLEEVTVSVLKEMDWNMDDFEEMEDEDKDLLIQALRVHGIWMNEENDDAGAVIEEPKEEEKPKKEVPKIVLPS